MLFVYELSFKGVCAVFNKENTTDRTRKFQHVLHYGVYSQD